MHHWQLYRHIAGTSHGTQSAGIGGGPIINICLMLGLGYQSRKAMSVTYIFLMGGSLASIFQNLTKRRPNGNLLIDYNLVALTAPMITTGSLFGVWGEGYADNAKRLSLLIYCDTCVHISTGVSDKAFLQEIYGGTDCRCGTSITVLSNDCQQS